MPITLIQDLEVDAPLPRFSELQSLICQRARNLGSDAAIAVVVPTDALPDQLGVDSEVSTTTEIRTSGGHSERKLPFAVAAGAA